MKSDALKLLTNHMDAWGLAFGLSALALVLHSSFSPRGVALALSVTLCYWLGFALNDYFDADYDRHDGRKAVSNFFARHHVPRRWLWTGLLIASALSFAVFAAFELRGLLLYGLGYVVMWAYSAPPLRLKSRPVADLLVHAGFVETYPYFVMLSLLGLTVTPLDKAMLLIFVLTSLTAQLEQQLRDYRLDSSYDSNFTTRFGPRVTGRLLRSVSVLLIIMVLLGIASGLIPAILLPFGLIMLPIMLHRLIRSVDQPRSEALIRLALIVALLYTSFLWLHTRLI